LKENKLQEAEEYSRKAIKIYDASGNKDGLIFCYGTLGQVKAKQKKYEEARSDLNLAIKNASESGQLNHLKNNYLNLSSLDSSQGKFRDAYENYKRYFVYYDSIFSRASTQKITEQKMEYLFERKQVADSIAFAHEKEIVKLQLKDQRIISFLGFGISLVTLVLLTFVFISYQKQKKAMIQLKETQNQLVKSEKLAAFGVMASRVSHEIQNPLNFVNNFSLMSKDLVNDLILGNTVSERKESGEMLLSNLSKIHEHGKRAALIIQTLQEHSRRGTAHYFFEK
jgi:two-component system NtrC family sensor kinase